MKLRYTPQALAELAEILAYVAERSPQGAGRIQKRLQSAMDHLLMHPRAGKVTSLRRLRRATTPLTHI